MWNIRSVLSTDSQKTEVILGSTAPNTVIEDDAVSTTNDGNSGHEFVDRTLSSVDGGFGLPSNKDASFICAPYKDEVFRQQIDETAPGSGRRTAIIGALQDMGVKVFIIDSVSTPSIADVIHHVRRVVGYIAKENRVLPRSGPLGYQRCLLYQDHQGRLFNLILSRHAIGPASTWMEYLDTFSGREAMVALCVLCRSLPCISSQADLEQLKPAYLSLVLGLVLMEEMSLSWLNASMMIRSMPSVSAHSLTSPLGADMLKKATLFFLAIASAAESPITTKVLTLLGISGAIMVLLANLGARAWYFMKWKPQRYDGIAANVLAYLAAIVTGLVLPYMGHRNITVGGKAAMEYVITTAFIVALAFIISDIDKIQEFLVVGSESCSQDMVNFVVGSWWFVTLICSLFLVKKVPEANPGKPHDAEKLLVEDHASPAGYKIPSLPDYEVDPTLANRGWPCLSSVAEFWVGIVMAFLIAGLIVWLPFTSYDEELASFSMSDYGN